MPSSKRNRQSRLTFNPLPSSSPALSPYNQQVRDRAAAVRYDPSPSPMKRRKVRDLASAHLQEDDGNGLKFLLKESKKDNPLPTPSLTAPTVLNDTKDHISDGEKSEPIRSSVRMSNRKRAKQRKLDFTPSSPSAKHTVVGKRTRPAKLQSTPRVGFFGTQTQTAVSLGDSASSDDEVGSQPPGSSPPHPQTQLETRTKAADPAVDVDASEDEDDVPKTPGNRRRRKEHAQRAQENSSPVIIDEDSAESDDSDVIVVPGSRKRSLDTKKRAHSVSSDEDVPATARKRLRRGNGHTLKPITEEERQDLEEDLQDLASSGSDTEIRMTQRSGPQRQKTAREEALAKLKQRRQGIITIESDEDEDDDDGYEEDIAENFDVEDDVAIDQNNRRTMFNRDEDDEGFIIEDDEGTLGAPTGLPLEFTRYAAMKAKDLFKYAVEWMVQKKINPAFQIKDQLYDLTFKKLDDEVQGLAGSKFKSAAWTQDFTFALMARPEILSVRMDRASSILFLSDKCDACNRSGHPATYEVQFKGTPYHPNTLDEVARPEDSSDSDSEESEDEAISSDRDYRGRQIPTEDMVFNVGKFCMRNAETAHALEHWRYHLYEWVVEYLESAGYNTPEMIVNRDKWSTHKRGKYANKIVDAMQTDGKVKALYRDFKNQIDTARNAKQHGRYDSSP